MEPKPKPPIDSAIDHILISMTNMKVGSEEHYTAAQAVKVLYEARAKRRSLPVEPEALLMAAVNILGIMLIIRHEQFNVVATRAIGFVRKY